MEASKIRPMTYSMNENLSASHSQVDSNEIYDLDLEVRENESENHYMLPNDTHSGGPRSCVTCGTCSCMCTRSAMCTRGTCGCPIPRA